MSVVKSQRSEGNLVVISKANNLATYTIHICSNEKNFPKRYRWCLSSKIVDAAIEICENINKGNSVYVKTAKDFEIRHKFQVEALSATYSLLTVINIAYDTFRENGVSITSDRLEHWVSMVYEVQQLIRKWRDADNERYKNIG